MVPTKETKKISVSNPRIEDLHRYQANRTDAMIALRAAAFKARTTGNSVYVLQEPGAYVLATYLRVRDIPLEKRARGARVAPNGEVFDVTFGPDPYKKDKDKKKKS